MRILLVNDDGILAPGLAALRLAVADMGEVTIVAPDAPQSAAGRSITLHVPIVCQNVHVEGAFWGTSVAGRPADCVRLAVRELMTLPPDLVLSGINAGANVGVNVFYSGTVAAAAEGALFGIPSVAFSLASGGDMDFHRAAKVCRQVLDGLMTAGLARGELVNVNLPPQVAGGPRGVKVVPQSTAAITEEWQRHDDGSGRLLFSLTDHYEYDPEEGESDVTSLYKGFITVTPLKSDLTDRAGMAVLAQYRWSAFPG